MENRFRIDISSDLDYEDLIADIYFKDQILAIVSQEEGFQNMRIQIYSSPNDEFWDFRFDEFEEIIQKAKKRLWELRKTPEQEDQ